MIQELTKLAEARHREQVLSGRRKALEEELAENAAWIALEKTKAEIKESNATQEELKLEVYSIAVQRYADSNGENVQPHAHVKIQMGTDIVYREDAAIEFALANDWMHLLNISLRKRDFEKFARAGWPMYCVTIEENTPKPVIDSDLSDMLNL